MAQMLSLLCPILVAVRIFPEMLMQLEMRFGFDGKEYGAGHLSGGKSLEVDAVEDTNDPHRGPLAVLQGWRFVSHRRAKRGWVPDNHVQARGLLVAGEVVTKFMLRFKKVRAQGIGDNATRNSIVGEDLAQIKHLRGLLPVCEVFAEVLQNIIRLREARTEASFEALGLKAESNRGFDVDRKNRSIDYGNEEYPVLLWTMAMCCGEVARCLEVLSRRWPSLLPRCNTVYGLVRQADLIEILMSTLRGTSVLFAVGELKTLREVSLLQTRFQELCYLMQTVHLLKARLTDGYLKHKKETIRRCVHHACVHPSPPAHHRCGCNRSTCIHPSPHIPLHHRGGYNRSMCTSRPRHTVAAHVRLQPHYACILPCPFAAQVGTILGGGRTRGSLGKWRCVCPRPSCYRVLGILRLRQRFKEQ